MTSRDCLSCVEPIEPSDGHESCVFCLGRAWGPGHPKSLPMEIGLSFITNKGPSVPQIIKLLDWEDDTDHCVMVMERHMPCMNLNSFMKLHRGSAASEAWRPET
ncbi:hypothetical protein G5714_002884 [Onychostoma macrolepis]|uniref:non-specific serine/threonine protein kinase n=1 Tax=Onychostoma macrolepis TaxID=369639 RepID=A0A7J6D8N4_9TELE|nr:hypothetical protein G5714_002884 [Onychostoma macrolepis]